MVGRFLVFGLLLTALPVFAEPPPGPPKDRKAAGDWHHGDHKGGDFPDKFRKRLAKMSPEDRERFIENWKRWKEMGDRERRAWQARAEEERRRVDKAISDTLKKLELDLDEDEREVFALRYRQERRKIEKELCSEMQAKRAQMIEAMQGRLKEEFAAKSGTKPAATPEPTPEPAQSESN